MALREAFDLAATGLPEKAADRLQKTMNTLDDKPLRGWLREQKAAYLHQTNAVSAQQSLVTAVGENQFVLRPLAGVTSAQIKPAAVQARAAAKFLANEYADGSQASGRRSSGGQKSAIKPC
ncbi:hypothetical protein AB0M68_32565 [Streptomyces sp. NPDC051453]|uniref:hypothetical protein n=1 Tax=Streptomyces sp. NPDC051453 TaxID=3154941 RepID=UPI0034266C5A